MRKVVSLTIAIVSVLFSNSINASEPIDKLPTQKLNGSFDAGKPLSKTQQRKQAAERQRIEEQLKLDRERLAKEEAQKQAAQAPKEGPPQLKMDEGRVDGWDDFDPNLEQVADSDKSNNSPAPAALGQPSSNEVLAGSDIVAPAANSLPDGNAKAPESSVKQQGLKNVASPIPAAIEKSQQSKVEADDSVSEKKATIVPLPIPEAVEKNQQSKVESEDSESEKKASTVTKMIEGKKYVTPTSYTSMIANAAVNTFTLLWKGEENRYAEGTFPHLTYEFVLNLMNDYWFKGVDKTKLTRDHFRYKLLPIEFNKGSYFVPVKVSFGRLNITITDKKKYRHLNGRKGTEGKFEDENEDKFLNYLKCLKEADTKSDMSFFNPTFIEEKHVLNPYDFFKAMRPYIEQDSDQAPLYRDILFCERSAHLTSPASLLRHTYTKLVYRLLIYNRELGYAEQFSLLGYRVHGPINGPQEMFVASLEQYEEYDWQVASGE